MKVWNRINARKIVLSYFYQRCFFINLEKQINLISSDILFVENIFMSQWELFDKAKKELEQKIRSKMQIDEDEDLEYFINIFFNKRDVENIDMDYVFKVWSVFEKYYQKVVSQVNSHTQSFSFPEMNTMNQALFVLWYIERKVLETPKEILLNELIELSKRYDDGWSPKLINWIMHNIVNG
jgi:transcription termination factor NusB